MISNLSTKTLLPFEARRDSRPMAPRARPMLLPPRNSPGAFRQCWATKSAITPTFLSRTRGHERFAMERSSWWVSQLVSKRRTRHARARGCSASRIVRRDRQPPAILSNPRPPSLLRILLTLRVLAPRVRRFFFLPIVIRFIPSSRRDKLFATVYETALIPLRSEVNRAR